MDRYARMDMEAVIKRNHVELMRQMAANKREIENLQKRCQNIEKQSRRQLDWILLFIAIFVCEGIGYIYHHFIR